MRTKTKKIFSKLAMVVCMTLVLSMIVFPFSSKVASAKPSQTVKTLAVGDSAKIKLNVKGKVVYKSLNTKIATVTSAGKVTAKRVGETKIKMTANGRSHYTNIIVDDPVLNETEITLIVGETFDLEAEGTNRQKMQGESDDTDIAELDWDQLSGEITAVSPGECYIIVTHDTVELLCKVTVITKEEAKSNKNSNKENITIPDFEDDEDDEIEE